MEGKTIYSERQIEIIEAATKRIDNYGIQELTIKNLAADIFLSEAALYRHFKSKNDILVALLRYSILEMRQRIEIISLNDELNPIEKITGVFNSQLESFVAKPAIVSVIFSEGIFQFNKELSAILKEMMDLMHQYISMLIEEGQSEHKIIKAIGSGTQTTIIMGSMRFTVLKWKISGHQADLVQEGNTVLSAILKMITKSE
jgi:TetR/AcrR family fatty acid metabolism transcriptional regulator